MPRSWPRGSPASRPRPAARRLLKHSRLPGSSGGFSAALEEAELFSLQVSVRNTISFCSAFVLCKAFNLVIQGQGCSCREQVCTNAKGSGSGRVVIKIVCPVFKCFSAYYVWLQVRLQMPSRGEGQGTLVQSGWRHRPASVPWGGQEQPPPRDPASAYGSPARVRGMLVAFLTASKRKKHPISGEGLCGGDLVPWTWWMPPGEDADGASPAEERHFGAVRLSWAGGVPSADNSIKGSAGYRRVRPAERPHKGAHRVVVIRRLRWSNKFSLPCHKLYGSCKKQ